MKYQRTLDGIAADMLEGFFVGWPSPPKPETHLRLLENSSHVVLAVDEELGRVVGFITAISDGVLSAYIPLLEVLPDFQKKGIGKELVSQMLDALRHLYMVDLCCDDELVPYYEKIGMSQVVGMVQRNYARQAGE